MDESIPFKARLRKDKIIGTIEVRIVTPLGVQWLSTGTRDFDEAARICDAAMVQELQMAACSTFLGNNVMARVINGRKNTCQRVLDGWASEMRANMAPTTIYGYEVTLKRMFADLECAGQPVSAIVSSKLVDWVNESRVPFPSRVHRLKSAKSFFKFCSALGLCHGNPAKLIKVQVRDLYLDEIEVKETLPFTQEEYRLLMNSPEVPQFWRWAVCLSYWLGLRLKDIACLQWDSIQTNQVVLYPQKTGRRLVLQLGDPLIGGDDLLKVIAEMCELKLTMVPQRRRYCFTAKKDIALDIKKRSLLSAEFLRILRDHGIVGKRFHSLRHASAMRLKASGRTLEEIASVLGHSSTEATKVYVTHEQQHG